jgi:hypothetical protein
MKWMLVALSLLYATPLAAQVNWPCDALPCLSDRRLNGAAHDAAHSAEALAVAQALKLAKLEERHRYLLATIALPIVQETIDLAFVSDRKLSDGPSLQSLMDLPTYQGAWLVPLLRRKKYVEAALLGAAWSGYIYWRYYARE